jgi:hypothetical protein
MKPAKMLMRAELAWRFGALALELIIEISAREDGMGIHGDWLLINA